MELKNLLTRIKIGTETLMFGDIEIEKYKFQYYQDFFFFSFLHDATTWMNH